VSTACEAPCHGASGRQPPRREPRRIIMIAPASEASKPLPYPSAAGGISSSCRNGQGLPLLLPARASGEELEREDRAALEGRQQVPQPRVPPHCGASSSVFPRDPALLSGVARRKPPRLARALVARELAKAVYYVLRRQKARNGVWSPLRRQGRARSGLNSSYQLRSGSLGYPLAQNSLMTLGRTSSAK
jgi:hypothetical protein